MTCLRTMSGETLTGFSVMVMPKSATPKAPAVPPRYCVECGSKLNSYNARITNRCCACTWRLMDGVIGI